MKIQYPENEDEFKNLHTNNLKKYIVVFSASWCAPCQKLKPELINYVNNINNDTVLLIYLDSLSLKEYKVATRYAWATISKIINISITTRLNNL